MSKEASQYTTFINKERKMDRSDYSSTLVWQLLQYTAQYLISLPLPFSASVYRETIYLPFPGSQVLSWYQFLATPPCLGQIAIYTYIFF